MKLFLLLLLSVFLFGSCNGQKVTDSTPVQSRIETGQIVGKSPQSIEGYQDQLGLQFTLEPVAVLSGDYNYDGILDTLRFMKISDWGDPGDFHQVEFIVSGEDIKEYFNGSGWVRPMNLNKPDVNNINYESLEYALKFSKASRSTIFVFYGYPYASLPWLTSIVKITKSGVELIFNDNQVLSEINGTEISFVKVLPGDIKTTTPRNRFKLNGLWLQPVD